MKTEIENLASHPDFDKHEKIICMDDRQTGLKGYIAIHRCLRPYPSFGATRMAAYKSNADALKDALRLSHLMSYKNIMAGLSYGGAKAVIIQPPHMSPAQKRKILAAYAKKVNELGGKFITGADFGIAEKDLKFMGNNSPYMVGLKSQPVPYTALGIFYSLKATLHEVFGSDKINGRTFAIQGAGKIGSGLLKLIYRGAKRIYIADIDPAAIKEVKTRFPKINIVSPNEIFTQETDVFCPCALGGALNSDSIKKLRCKIVCGGANNQLENPAIGAKLFKRGILYAPDFVINAGGVISVADEYENPKFNKAKLEDKIKNIAKILKNIFDFSNRKHRPTNQIADEIARTILDKKYEKTAIIARIQ